jgi:hypothetical protein
MMMTVQQAKILRDHVEWCRKMNTRNDAQIAIFDEPGTRIIGHGAGEPDMDITHEHVARLHTSNEEYQRVIEAFTLSGGFQTQVNAEMKKA